MYRKFLAMLILAAVVMPADRVRAEYGTLTGRFVFDGDPPKASKLTPTKDVTVCGKHPLFDESVVVNPDNSGVANVVLYLYVGRGKKAPQPHESYADTADGKVTLDNLNCRFEPHVALLRTSQTLVVSNSDPVGHNTKIDTIKNVPANPIIPASAEQEFQFPKEERLPSRISCSIHPWMNAILVIKDTPYMAVTDENGSFTIENVPVGKWTFQVWHEKGGYVDSVNLKGKKTRWSKGRFDHKITAGQNDLGEIKVTAAAFK